MGLRGENPISIENMIGSPARQSSSAQVPGTGIDLGSSGTNLVNLSKHVESKGVTNTSSVGTKNEQKGTKAASQGLIVISDMINALEKYERIKENTRTNIMLATQRASEAIALGKTEAFQAQVRGEARGQDALLSAADQGQSVGGATAKGLQAGEELFGLYESMIIESNAIKESYGHEVEIDLMEFEEARAKLQRDSELWDAFMGGGFQVFSSIYGFGG